VQGFELRAQRLGREIGDIIPRADYERQLRALAYWLVRCVDDAKAFSKLSKAYRAVD
jgi:hypothetical protein